MYFEFIIAYDRPPEYIYTDSKVCDEYSFLTQMPLDQFYSDLITLNDQKEGFFIFSDGFNTIEGKL
jgi:hypothetical protein